MQHNVGLVATSSTQSQFKCPHTTVCQESFTTFPLLEVHCLIKHPIKHVPNTSKNDLHQNDQHKVISTTTTQKQPKTTSLNDSSQCRLSKTSTWAKEKKTITFDHNSNPFSKKLIDYQSKNLNQESKVGIIDQSRETNDPKEKRKIMYDLGGKSEVIQGNNDLKLEELPNFNKPQKPRIVYDKSDDEDECAMNRKPKSLLQNIIAAQDSLQDTNRCQPKELYTNRVYKTKHGLVTRKNIVSATGRARNVVTRPPRTGRNIKTPKAHSIAKRHRQPAKIAKSHELPNVASEPQMFQAEPNAQFVGDSDFVDYDEVVYIPDYHDQNDAIRPNITVHLPTHFPPPPIEEPLVVYRPNPIVNSPPPPPPPPPPVPMPVPYGHMNTSDDVPMFCDHVQHSRTPMPCSLFNSTGCARGVLCSFYHGPCPHGVHCISQLCPYDHPHKPRLCQYCRINEQQIKRAPFINTNKQIRFPVEKLQFESRPLPFAHF